MHITPREQQVIALVAEGCSNREIAKIIGTTQNVVENYLRSIYDKTGMWGRLELALWYVKENQPTPIEQVRFLPAELTVEADTSATDLRLRRIVAVG